MRALQVEHHGTAPTLRDVPEPEPASGEVAIRVAACGLNFADLLMVQGTYQERPPLPLTLGMEFAGAILKVGADVDGFRPGGRVAAFAGHGGLADVAVVPAERVILIPDAMPFEDAAAFQIAYGTSHVGLERRARLMAGETLLVLGAAGGVGLTAVELGKLMGARVIGVARGPEKLDVVRTAGADHAFDSDQANLATLLRDLGGCDVVYDPVGGALFAEALRACRPEARYLVVGFAGGVPEVRPNHLLVKNIALIGHYLGGYSAFRPEIIRDSLARLLDWYDAGRIRPHIGLRLPLERAAEGLDLLRRRKTSGKVVVQVAR